MWKLNKSKPLLTLKKKLKLFSMEDILSKKISNQFSKSDQKNINSILNSYGHETYQKESTRVRLAILKLSAGRTSQIKKFVKAACRDYRDILAMAEYPRQSGDDSKTDPKKRRDNRDNDSIQYAIWLSTYLFSDEIFNTAITYGQEFGENWLVPINEKIKAKYATLSDTDATILNSISELNRNFAILTS